MQSRESAIIAVLVAATLVAKEGYFVKVDTNEKLAAVTAASDIPFGVVTLGKDTTQLSSVAVCGGCQGTFKVKLGATPGTVKRGTYLQLNADGTVKADAGTGARVIVALAIESGAANEQIDAVLLVPTAKS